MINSKYLITISLCIIGITYFAFADSKTPLQECQEAYMLATNELYRYNENHSRYKVSLPEYDCNTWTASGAIVPPPLGRLQWEALELNDAAWMLLEKLHTKICQKQINSPLCKDRALFDRLYQITEERLPWKNFFPILIWMTNAESSLWLDFAKDNIGGTCIGRNNWGGAKYKINDDNTREYSRSYNWFLYWSKYSWRFVDQYGCNLFPFMSIDEYWISKTNWIKYGYKWCIDSKTPIRCLSYAYVWRPDVAEQSWIDNVSYFLN